jgi:glycosyltransferase involved in cell wall biosynthesis
VNKIGISVVLNSFNGEKYIAKQLDSIINQTILIDEIIILDDASVDDTLEILNTFATKYSNIHICNNNQNLGLWASFKRGLELAKYEYLFLADQDDIWALDKVEKMIKMADCKNSNLPLLIYSDLKVINESDYLIHNSFWELAGLNPKAATFHRLMYGNVVTGCASLINGKMKEYLLHMPEDMMMHDHWMALIAYGFGQFDITDEPLVNYRAHFQSVTEKSRAGFRWKLKKQLSQFSNNRFLENEIKQMRAFGKLYLGKLSNENRIYLLQFISLSGKSLLRKKMLSLTRFRNLNL